MSDRTPERVPLAGWGDAAVPLIPADMRFGVGGTRSAPAAILEAADALAGILRDLDGTTLTPLGRQWPDRALTEASDVFQQLLFEHPELERALVLPESPVGTLPRWAFADVPVPVRAVNSLGRRGLLRIPDLAGLQWGDLLELRGLGCKTLLALLCTLEHILPLLPTVPPPAGYTDSNAATPSPEVTARLADWEADPLSSGSVVAELVEALVDQLQDPRMPKILRRRLGWDAEESEPDSLAELGIEFGVTRERVRQIETSAWNQVSALFAKHVDAPTVTDRLLRRCAQDAIEEWLVLAGQVWPGSAPAAAHLLYCLAHGAKRGDSAWKQRWKEWQDHVQERAHLDTQLQKRSMAEDRHRATLQRRFSRILSGAQWPENFRTGTSTPPSRVSREVGGGDGYLLWWPSAKLGRQVACESATELAFFALCDAAVEVDWYAEQPLRLSYSFEGREHRYHPDGLLALRDGRLLLAEVKPMFQASLAVNHAKWTAAWAWCVLHGVGFLVTDDHQPLSEWASRPVSFSNGGEGLVADVNQRLGHGTLTYEEVKQLRERHQCSSGDFTRLALMQGWQVRIRPWRLSFTANHEGLVSSLRLTSQSGDTTPALNRQTPSHR